MRTITQEEWLAEGEKLFGNDRMKWRFACPSCGHVASVKDWETAGAPEASVAFSCIGRWSNSKQTIFQKDEGKGCNYAGGGLFGLNPVSVVVGEGREPYRVFEFAPGADSTKEKDRMTEHEPLQHSSTIC